jgi:hypothetical protein
VVLSTPQQSSEAAAGVDQLGQELAALIRQAQHQHKRTHSSFTSPNIIQQTNQGIESLEAEEGGKVEQPLTRRRRAGTRSLPGGEGQVGVESGGEGQARSKPQLSSKQ